MVIKCRFRRPICRIPTLQHQVAQIVFSGDVETLKHLIAQRRERLDQEMFTDWINDSLFSAILRTKHPNSKKESILEYVLNLEEFDINFTNTREENCLMRSRLSDYPESILEALLKQGADITAKNVNGATLLHTGISDSFEDYEILLIEKAIKAGVDINAEDYIGQTPLYIACKRDLPKWIYFYLYHGANAAISTVNNILPLCMLSNESSAVANDLLDYTFHMPTSEIHLMSLIKLMEVSTSFELFENICKRCQTVTYNAHDIDFFAENSHFFIAKKFELFIKYYGHVIEDVIYQTSYLKILLNSGLHEVLPELKGILLALLHSNYISLFVQQNRDFTFPVVTCLIKVFNSDEDMFLNREEISQIVFLLLEYGLNISLKDLDTVYKYYGYGELLKTLLHVDVINPKQEQVLEIDHSPHIYEEEDVRNRHQLSAMIQLLYDPNKNVEECWIHPSEYLAILKRFNNAKVKEQIAINCQDQVLETLKRMPQVPLLTELGRNATRKFIMKRYNIKKHTEFYTILKALSLGTRYSRIIDLGNCLY